MIFISFLLRILSSILLIYLLKRCFVVAIYIKITLICIVWLLINDNFLGLGFIIAHWVFLLIQIWRIIFVGKLFWSIFFDVVCKSFHACQSCLFAYICHPFFLKVLVQIFIEFDWALQPRLTNCNIATNNLMTFLDLIVPLTFFGMQIFLCGNLNFIHIIICGKKPSISFVEPILCKTFELKIFFYLDVCFDIVLIFCFIFVYFNSVNWLRWGCWIQ